MTETELKKGKFNFGGLFFKRKTPIISIQRVDRPPPAGPTPPPPPPPQPEAALPPLLLLPPPAASRSPTILDDANHITIVASNESHPRPQHLLVPAATALTHANPEERYTSFTADCILLQNSDMTSHMDDDLNQNLAFNYSPIGQRLDAPVPPPETRPKATLRSILKNRMPRRAAAAPAAAPDAAPDAAPPTASTTASAASTLVGLACKGAAPAPSPRASSSSSSAASSADSHLHLTHARPVELSARSSTEDVTAYLPESESDLNFDPLQEENAGDYKRGGYHPVVKGETYYSHAFDRRYIVLRKLGWGHFSTVWLAKALDADGAASYVAIKFVKSNKHYLEAALDEILLLQTINQPLRGDHLTRAQRLYFKQFAFTNDEPTGHPGYKHVMKLLDNFEIVGPNGNHICMVFEVLGENVFNLMCKYKSFYANLTKEYKLKKEGRAPGSVAAPPSAPPAGLLSFGKKDKPARAAKKSTILKLSLGLLGAEDDRHATATAATAATADTADTVTAAAAAEPDDFLLSLAKTLQIIDDKIHLLDVRALDALIEQLRTHGGLPLLLVKQICRQIFLALDYIHHCGVIHTDLKPENVLIEIKNVMDLIRMIEADKVAKHRLSSDASSAAGSAAGSGGGGGGSGGGGFFRKSSAVLELSHTSGYRKSRIPSATRGLLHNSPIRLSKPLPSSITTDIIFKNVSYKDAPLAGLAVAGPAVAGPAVALPAPPLPGAPPTLSGLPPAPDPHGATPDLLILVKIADLGNGTFAHTHFTDQIQTRQYRLPEIIMGHKNWGASTDIWSIGCMVFELVTGDYLFDPHDGKHYDRDDDHMAQIVELLGEYPTWQYLEECRFAKDFFKVSPANEVRFRKIAHLKFWPLRNVLVEKYHFSKDDPNVALIADLVGRCLRFEPADRIDAASLARHPWFEAALATAASIAAAHAVELRGEDVPGYAAPYVPDEPRERLDNEAAAAFFE